MSSSNFGLAWSEDFELGCEEVDSQHRRLFELVGDLVKACTEGYEKNVLDDTLDFLVNYTVQHFYDEEEFQIRHNYPDYVRHKQIHDEFKESVGELVEEFHADGSTTELSSKVNKIVVRWIINHIQREDKRIGVHVRRLQMDE